MKIKSIHYFAFFIVILVGGIIAARYFADAQPGQYDELAQCINDSGAKFYGAFWCPHCQEQKRIFGNSEKLLPYIECSTPDGQTQLSVCADAGIESYPTWELSDGTRLQGVQTPTDLAEATNCALPS